MLRSYFTLDNDIAGLTWLVVATYEPCSVSYRVFAFYTICKIRVEYVPLLSQVKDL